MDSLSARKLINEHFGEQKVSTRNSSFANINKGKKVWWINPKQEKFSEDFYLLLNNGMELYVLFIPENTFRNLNDFRIRKDNGRIDLEISCDKDYRFLTDVKSGAGGVEFKPFIQKKVAVPVEMRNMKKTTNRRGVGKVQNQRIIKQDELNIAYTDLFASLKDADKVILQDPWIRLPYQFSNFLEFCVMLANIKTFEERLSLEVIAWNDKEFINNSKECFEEIKLAIIDLGVDLTYRFEKQHDRFIKTEDGQKIILGRGLDIYEKREGRFNPGDVDQRWRKCKACEITYLRE